MLPSKEKEHTQITLNFKRINMWSRATEEGQTGKRWRFCVGDGAIL